MILIKKLFKYFTAKPDEEFQNKAILYLNREEQNVFFGMKKYDRYHSLEVCKKIDSNDKFNNPDFLKLALLHDCGKGKTGIFLRTLHKIGIKTILRKHPEIGYEKIKNIDYELALLIKNHHIKNYSQEMDIFQDIDNKY